MRCEIELTKPVNLKRSLWKRAEEKGAPIVRAEAAGSGLIVVPRRLPRAGACYLPFALYQLKPLPKESIVRI